MKMFIKVNKAPTFRCLE